MAAPATAQTVAVSPAPERVAVSLYRDPDPGSDDAISREDPKGFAVISETRRVTLPRGPVTIRFEGVASGILPQTAIVVGPPTAARAQKQVAFFVQPRVPGELVHRVRIDGTSVERAERVYRMHNTAAGGLGRALPTGQWTLYQRARIARALVGQASLPDKTEGEDLELVLGESSVAVAVTGLTADRYQLVATNPTDDAVSVRLEFPTGDYRYEGLRWTERKPGRTILTLRLRAHGEANLEYRATEVEG